MKGPSGAPIPEQGQVKSEDPLVTIKDRYIGMLDQIYHDVLKR